MIEDRPDTIYCPVCGRYIEASNIKECEDGEHDGYLFVHDDIVHYDEDLEALNYEMQ